MANIVIVLTSHATFGGGDEPTGFWLEELAAPYYVFVEAEHRVVLASPDGGLPPLDPLSKTAAELRPAGQRWMSDQAALAQLAHTEALTDIDPNDFSAVFYPGGHGPMWDLIDNTHSLHLIEHMHSRHKPIGSICHGPVVLLNAVDEAGLPLVASRQLTCFSNREEVLIGRVNDIPFLLADALQDKGAHVEHAEPWFNHVVRDANLITGQNPSSAVDTAVQVVKQLYELPG